MAPLIGGSSTAIGAGPGRPEGRRLVVDQADQGRQQIGDRRRAEQLELVQRTERSDARPAARTPQRIVGRARCRRARRTRGTRWPGRGVRRTCPSVSASSSARSAVQTRVGQQANLGARVRAPPAATAGPRTAPGPRPASPRTAVRGAHRGDLGDRAVPEPLLPAADLLTPLDQHHAELRRPLFSSCSSMIR